MWILTIFALLTTTVHGQFNITFDAIKVMGYYGLISNYAPNQPGGTTQCSNFILHKGTPNVNGKKALSLPRSNIYHLSNESEASGVPCSEGFMVLWYKPTANPTWKIGQSDIVYKTLNDTSTNIWWVQKETRTCGTGSNKWVLQNPTAYYLTFNPEQDVPGPNGVTLGKNQRYLILTNAFYTCVYRGIPSPSEKEKKKDENKNTPKTGDNVLPTPQPPNLGDGPSVCFPADATVRLRHGIKRMDQLTVGDSVHVGNGEYSNVFMFSHKQYYRMYDFLTLSTDTGHQVTLTPSHYLYVNGILTAAASVKVGDALRTSNGAPAYVVKVENERRQGLYNPHTSHGNIEVNGIVTSTFTTTVAPPFAFGLLAPLRALYRRLGLALHALNNGADCLARWAPKGPLQYLHV